MWVKVSSGERSYLRQQVEHLIRSKRKVPRSGERSYWLKSMENEKMPESWPSEKRML